MTKKNKSKPQRTVTKRQLSRWQQQKRRQRIVFITGVVIIIAALTLTGVGWYFTSYRPLHEIAIKVNDTEFNMDYYTKTLKFYATGQEENIQYLAEQVVQAIQQDELMRQGAEELGITISDEVINEKLQDLGLPLSKELQDLARAELLTNKLDNEYFKPQVPGFAEQINIMTMFLESDHQAAEVRARLENGELFTQLASELSLDDYTKAKRGILGWRPAEALTLLLDSSVPAEEAFNAEVGTLIPPIYDETKGKIMGYWIIKVIGEKGETEEVHVQAILLGSEKDAQQVKARLEAGEDFTTLAKELSQHETSKEDGGDLGWLPPESMYSIFDEFAFSSDLETLSEPIRDDITWTESGYWLIKILARDNNRQIEGENSDLLKANLWNDWTSSLWDNNESESYLDESQKLWAISKVLKELT